MIRLYSYFRSSAAYRVRIALNLKQIDYQLECVNLLQAEERQATYTRLNPQQLVPACEHNGHILYQSQAILEYLEEVFPDPPLLPSDHLLRADIRALCNVIACDIHPLNNLRVLNYLKDAFEIGAAPNLDWYRHWIAAGFSAIESRLEARSNGRFCFAETPGMAEALLVPQVYNARRFELDMAAYPTIDSIDRHCRQLTAFARAAPENQPDAT